MEHANPVATPLDNTIIVPNPDESDGDRSNPFTKLLGELQYLADATRPDISYAVNRLGLYMANPSLTHYRLLKRILRYLAGTRNYGITYRRSQTPYMPILGFADTVFANADDKKSTTGLVFLIGGGAVLWKSIHQTLSALSTTEAEFIALAHAGVEAHWFRNLFTEL